MDNSKAVLKEIISEDVSCTYDADDDATIVSELSETATVIVGSSNSDYLCLIFT